jgi:hypothetical protein
MSLKFDARTVLAFGITSISLIGITYLSVKIITSTGTDAKAQNVLNSVLPLFGTWVGTVLAYYFSRDNFEAASASTERLVRQLSPEEKLRSTMVADVMSKNIVSIMDLNAKVEDEAKKLLSQDSKRYLPILKSSNVIETLLYREGLFSYLYDLAEAERPNKTIKNLLKERPDLKQPYAFVAETGTLAEAKDEMEKIKNCKAVFITKNGNPKEAVIGLLTTTDIAKYSRP